MGASAYWFESDVFYKKRFETSVEDIDICDLNSYFWSALFFIEHDCALSEQMLSIIGEVV